MAQSTSWDKKKVIRNEEWGQLLVTLDGILSHGECKNLISKANDKGWKESSPSGGGNGRTGREDPRTNTFCVMHDQAFADVLWSRVSNFLPPDLSHIPYNTYLDTQEKGKEWKPVGVVDKLRFYKYEVGQEFPEHVDYKSGRDIVRLVNGTPTVSFFVFLICGMQFIFMF